jgi:SAM-dependent methyltransferase
MDEYASLLRCPSCLGSLVRSAETLLCRGCSSRFEIDGGVPLLLVGLNGQKRRQAQFFDSGEDLEFETSRPHGSPTLYAWLLDEKFNRGTSVLRSRLRGATALAVCAGSGMDAELLARAGARVIAADISLGAVKRAGERARRYGVDITPIVADIERLPFADESIDVVYVHDGLHHLERPLAGLGEMARVARYAVSVTEPARAAVTNAAVRLGLALEREGAGNRVERLTLDEIGSELAKHGLRVEAAERYGMFYRHEPGWAMRLFSRPALFQLARASFWIGNATAGRLGNKLAVQAVRTSQ